ncbi:ATP-binding protein [Rhizobium puerariae]|uniref:histidine kinase n=1 Tax=Rhizobium puerariae TaxID=1585791 RepID=A0ABV6ARG0_9HYPH
MAHEFNNILTTILGYAEMLAEMLPPESAALDYAEQIVESGRRAERIVEQVLIISRRGRHMSRPFDVLEAASEMLPALYTSVSQTTRLDIEIADEPMAMFGTPRDLQHVLVNLCRNASEAQDGGGAVLLKIAPFDPEDAIPMSHGTLKAGAYLRMSVGDAGPGIRPEHAPRIFEPFFTTGGEKRRVGLGLSVVEATVRALKGQIDVGPGPDGGTCFTVFFPRLPEVAG